MLKQGRSNKVMDKIKEIGNTIREGWMSLTPSKRKKMIAIVSVAAALLLMLAYFAQRTTYTVLFSNLDEADAGAIVEDLETQNMTYRLEDSGRTILIDEQQVDHYRINLAVDGLMPDSSTGFEIFDNTSMMATDDDRQIMYQRAIQGELERSIASLQQVESARVTLSIPEDSIFQNPEYQSESSASILLQTRGTAELSSQAIQGIASLVTGAVDNLPIANIQIIDTNGNLLSAFLQNDGNSFGTNDIATYQQQIRRTYEQDLEQRITALLSPVYGSANVRVNVSALMNFDAVEGERIEYESPITVDPENPEQEGLIRSQTESFNGAGELLQGLIEAGEMPVADDGDAGDNNSYESVINYELNQITERYIQAPGLVEGISAQVIVNQNVGAGASGDQIEEIVSNALGLTNGEVTGQVVFNSMPFADESDESIIGDFSWTDTLINFLLNVWPYMTAGFIILIVGIVFLVMLRRGREENEALDEIDDFPEMPLPASEPIEDEGPDPSELIDAEQEMKKQKNTVMSEKEDRVREQAKQSPELAAELMKIWLKE